jgi:hypothetical protein
MMFDHHLRVYREILEPRRKHLEDMMAKQREQLTRAARDFNFRLIGLPTGEWYRVPCFSEPPVILTPEMRVDPPAQSVD